MKTLLTIMVLTNSEESPNIAVLARLAHAKKSRVFTAKQAGLIFAHLLLLLRRVRIAVDARSSMRSAHLLSKGDENVLITLQRKYVDNLFGCGGPVWNLFVVPLFLSSIGDEYGNFNVHCKSLGLFVDSRRGRPELLAGLEKFARHPCLEFERIIDITDKLTKWIKKVKKIILSRKKMFNRK